MMNKIVGLFVWILVTSMLIVLLCLASISLAEEGKWTQKADMPTARWGLSTCAVNGKIYAIGGSGEQDLSRVEKYDPATDRWTAIADMPTARRWLSTSVVNGKIYAIGGCAEQEILATVEVYDTGFDVDAKGKLATCWGRLKGPEE